MLNFTPLFPLALVIVATITGLVKCATISFPDSSNIGTETVSEKKLKFVAVVLRHGDRSPGRIIPMKNYSISYWPKGLKKLTPLGIEQTFGVGQYLRDHYGDLLGEKYSVDKVHVRSSSEDRAIDSAISLLHGLYPEDDQQEWNKQSMSHTISVETAPTTNDPLLKPSKYNCPTLNAWKRMTRSLLWDAMESQPHNKEFLRHLRKQSDIPDLTLQNVEELYRPLLVQRIHGVGVPDWVDDAVWVRMSQLYQMAYTIEANDRVESKFRSGLLTGEIMRLLEDKMSNSPSDADSSDLAMKIYSTHAGTLLPLLSNFGIFDGEFPAYASALMIELWEQPQPSSESPSQYYVAFKFRNETNHNVYNLVPHGCHHDESSHQEVQSPLASACHLEDLKAFLRNRMYRSVDELNKEDRKSVV